MSYADLLLTMMTTEGEITYEEDRATFARLIEEGANKLGVNVIRSNDDETYPFGWDGKVIRIDGDPETSNRASYDLAHELAHFIVAAPQRRMMTEFGLGEGFSTSAPVEAVASQAVCEFEEDCACLLAGMIAYWVGLPTLQESVLVQFVDEYEGKKRWNPRWGADKKTPGIIEHLIEWGVIDSDLRPLFVVRTSEIDPI